MSYYSSQTGQHTPGTYPYSVYHPGAYGQTPGAYSYQTTGGYPAAGYGTTWPYSYSYYQPRPAVSGTTSSTTTTGQAQGSTSTTPAPQRPTFNAYTPSYGRESVAAAATGGATGRGGYKKQSHFKGLFTKELRSLMYGFGDDRNPANDTVNVMEEILVEYIADVCQTALAPTKKSRLSIEDFRRALSRSADAKKLARMEELLFMQEDIKRARAVFNDSEGINPSQAL